MTPLAQRRRQELDLKLKSLEDELKAWADRTTREPMRRHYSQVARLTTVLNTLLESMKTSTGWKAPTDDIVLAKAAAWEKRILTAHAIWELFRSKLAQRSEVYFQEQLLAYDDLAWACYEPAMTRFAKVPKEPPLLYLNSTWSAFLRPRDTTFEKELEQGKDAGAAIDAQDYRTTIQKLPFPLLALPWFQVAHAPSALLIAHEVGHAVEFDFDLTSAIDNALKGAQLQHAADWRGASSEVFADLYGCLCLGGYFAGSLLDLIVADRTVVAADDQFARYPPRAYRMELAVRALDFLGLSADALRVRQTWETVYGPTTQLPGYTADAEQVVKAIYGENGMNLSTLIRPPDANIAAVAQYAAQGNSKDVERYTDARVLFCALRHVYENGTPAGLTRASPLLLKQVGHANAAMFRYRGAPVASQTDTDAKLAALEASDRAAGKELETLLGFEVDQDGDPENAPAGP
jgi:hypothetical protein